MSTSLRRYYRGDELVGLRDGQASATRYYHFDHQGTTQCLTDRTGGVTDRFASDAWGVPVKRAGTSINRQWYVGNWGYYRTAPNSEAYVRSRYYTSKIGRWKGVDPVQHNDHPYCYVSNVPTTRVDPLGLFWLTGQFTYQPPIPDPPLGWKSIVHGSSETYVFCMGVLATMKLLAGRSSRNLVTHWQLASGSVYTLPQDDMNRIVSKGSGYQNDCAGLMREGASFAEFLFEGNCPDPAASKMIPIWRVGGQTGYITDTEDSDLGWSLGNGFAWAKAMVRCQCDPAGDLFYMDFTFMITDQFAGNKANRGYLNPFICHQTGQYRDFNVKGNWTKSIAWRRGRFQETADQQGTCP